LVKERYGDEAVNIGFTTYTGTVTAVSNWWEAAQLKQVRSALPGSYEALFHETEIPQFYLNLRDENQAIVGLRQPRLERAIGVIYQPETERVSHYFHACLPEQFDAVISIDDTKGVQPLDRVPTWEMRDAPETFPFGV
jgi:erythromycin esterase-like protein